MKAVLQAQLPAKRVCQRPPDWSVLQPLQRLIKGSAYRISCVTHHPCLGLCMVLKNPAQTAQRLSVLLRWKIFVEAV